MVDKFDVPCVARRDDFLKLVARANHVATLVVKSDTMVKRAWCDGIDCSEDHTMIEATVGYVYHGEDEYYPASIYFPFEYLYMEDRLITQKEIEKRDQALRELNEKAKQEQREKQMREIEKHYQQYRSLKNQFGDMFFLPDEIVQYGLNEDQEWPSETHRVTAERLLLGNGTVTTSRKLNQCVQWLIQQDEQWLKKATIHEIADEAGTLFYVENLIDRSNIIPRD